MIQQQVRFQSFTKGRVSDFSDSTPDTYVDILTTGASIRELDQEERTAQDLEATEDGLELTCLYNRVLEDVAPHSHVVNIRFPADNDAGFDEKRYRILRAGQGRFQHRKVKFIVGRNS